MVDSETQSGGKLRIQKHHNFSWADVQHPDRETLAQLEKDYRLHPLQLHESMQKVQHTQVEREDDYLFLVLHFPKLESKTNKISVAQIGIFLGRDFLVTIGSARSSAVTELFEAGLSSENHNEYFKHGPSYLLYFLISSLLDNIAGMIELVLNELDELEDAVFDNSNSDARAISELRQKIIRLRRIIGPKRLILADLAQKIDSFAGSGMRKYYSNNTKTVAKLWEEIEEAKEIVEIYKDTDFTTSTERTNKTLAILTLLFTFTLPITVVGTLYGMNVPLPGGIETGPWTFLGKYTSMTVLISISLLAALWMYFYFKKKRWF